MYQIGVDDFYPQPFLLNQIIVPRFKDSSYSQGVEEGVAAIIKALKKEPLGISAGGASNQDEMEAFFQIIPPAVIIGFVIGSMLLTIFGVNLSNIVTAIVTWIKYFRA